MLTSMNRLFRYTVTFFCLLLVHFAQSQDNPLKKEIMLPPGEYKVKSWLEMLSKHSGVPFSYVHSNVPLDETIRYSETHETLDVVLEKYLPRLGLEYTQVEGQIILKPAPPIPGPGPEKPKNFTLGGHVKEASSGEALIGATIYTDSLLKGTISNAYGFYSLTLPAGKYKVHYSFLGYSPRTLDINLQKNQVHEIALKKDSALLKEVRVYADSMNSMTDRPQMSSFKMKPLSLKQTTGFLGEADFLKSLQSMPGFNLRGDGSAFFHVRGGSRDQNLILVDEAPVYNPSHLFGFFSSLNAPAIQDVKVYKGDIPASLGGRLSSVIDIKTKEGNMNRFGLEGKTGPMSSNLSIEGPLVKENASFFLHGRRSHFTWLIPKFPESMKAYFHDFNAKANLSASSSDRFYVSFYTGKDLYSNVSSETGSFGVQWGNSAGTARWNHVFNEKLFCNTSLHASNYDYYLYLDYHNKNYWKSFVRNLTLKSDFTFYNSPEVTTRFGLGWKRHGFGPGNLRLGTPDKPGYITIVPNRYSREIYFYGGQEREWSDKFSMRLGFRLPIWQNIGETWQLLYDENHQVNDTIHPGKGKVYHGYFDIEPRLSLNYKLSPRISLKASYNKLTQHLQIISNSVSPFTGLDVWLPAGPGLKPQKVHQLNLGYLQETRNKKHEFTIETFYKFLKNQIGYVDHPNLMLNPKLEGELRVGKGNAYGIEAMAKKNTGQWTGWISYTYSRSFLKIPEINEGKAFPSLSDQPHHLNLFANYRSQKRWAFTFNWIIASGRPVSTPSGFHYYQGYQVPYYESRHNDRLPTYHRLDISGHLRLNRIEKRFEHGLVFTIYNFYGRQNPISINYNKILNENGNYQVPANLLEQGNRVNTKISLVGFFPMISYHFKF